MPPFLNLLKELALPVNEGRIVSSVRNPNSVNYKNHRNIL